VKHRRAAAPYAKALCALAKERNQTELVGRELGTTRQRGEALRWRA
jgi:F0F1-type ATP synthase delta subunit